MSFNFGSAASGSGGGFTFGGGDTNKPAFGASASNDKKGFNFGSPVGSSAPTFGGFTSPASVSSASVSATPPNAASSGLFSGTGVKSPSFGGFGTTANQNVVSPFGQTSQTQAPQAGGLNLSFGANTTAAQPTLGFGQPAAASAAPSTGLTFGSPAGAGGFAGFKTPASGFSAAPQAAPASTAAPSFNFGGGATGLSFGGANTSTGLSFGATTTTPAATGLSFGSPAATTSTGLSFNNPASTASTNLSFGSPGAAATSSTGLSFGNSGAAASTGLSFGNPAASTSTGLSFSSPAATTASPAFNAPSTGGANFNFTASTQSSAAPTTGLTFGGPTTSSAISFSAPPVTTAGFAATSTPASGIKFAAPTMSSGLSFGATGATASSSIATSTTAVPSTGLNFGTGATAASSASFGAPTTSSGFSFAPASSAGATLGVATSTATALSFNPPATISDLAKATPASNATSTPSTGFSLGLGATTSSQLPQKTPSTTTTSGLQGFSLPTTGAAVSTATTTPSGITALGQPTSTPQTTSMLSLTTATTSATTAAPPQPVSSLTFAQLEENINKWTSQLEEQEKLFINQATQINAWDRLLIQNGEKMVQLSEAVQSALDSQQAVEHELTFIEGQQKELEELLAPLEKDIAKDQRGRDPEREHMYQLAETLDTQLKQMSEDLKEVIQYLNETNRSQDSNDPIVQIGRILNAHMSSMQWVDNSIAQISTKLDQLKATHDTLRRDNEQSFHLTYN